jgi:hypothetical protein
MSTVRAGVEVGRQTLLTDEVHELYQRLVAGGVVPETAAKHCGFSSSSLYRWLKGSTPRHAAFRRAHEEALASFEIRLTATLSQAALTEPRWALVLLERRFPAHWARPGAGDHADAETERGPAVPEAPVVLDPAFIGELIPRLLEAGRQLSGRSADDQSIDMADFEDDGSAGERDE